jgi:hypothetical protein
VAFLGDNFVTWQFDKDVSFGCRAGFTNGFVNGGALTFLQPASWSGGTTGVVWTGTNPVSFLAGGNGKGVVRRPMVSWGDFDDWGVNSGPGGGWVNIAGQYHVRTGSANGTNSGGWFTNLFGGRVQFANDGAGTYLRWHLANEGVVGFASGARGRVLGNFDQRGLGQTVLNSSALFVISNALLSGTITGSGSITSYHAHVSARLSPDTPSSPFGRIDLRSLGPTSVGATNRVNLTTNTVLEVDLGVPGTTNDYFFIGSHSGSAAEIIGGRIDIRAQPGFGPGLYPFLRYVNSSPHNLRFGSVPPGYRYSLTNDTVTRHYQILVLLPASPVVQFSPLSQSGLAGLTINTISNTPYRVDYANRLAIDPWQLWTNFLGNGQSWSIPVELGTPTRFFRIQEGQ